MSAGRLALVGEPQPDHAIADLEPEMRRRVAAALAEANNAENDLGVVVYETWRSDALQRTYYRRGRPPSREYPRPVTNAPSAAYGWHGYKLAIDVVHRTLGWSAGLAWYRKVAAIFTKHGLKWGGAWKHPDYPHFQHAGCKPSPSAWARARYAANDLQAVWDVVNGVRQLTPDESRRAA